MMTQNDNSAIQDIAMAMIAYSGEGRTLAFNALDAMHRDDYLEAQALLKQSSEALVKAHDVQTKLLVAEANGQQVTINILLIHSQDHFMTSLLANELIAEILKVYHKFEGMVIS
ncbi:PTS lactose/cellobiose transporter subunit IIA [Lactiplantibacillus paraplantarum]|uniref:PTS lactose/cellobiose transporter subunit IIA n=1 Tax=Lactiplantibacillus paraplantarum TaxID=60520 RepID=UPI0006EEBB9C|nr:PTS lactose/cellobiose transporter subunit IIA [Lactiplantibacillus paraplantarum]KRL49960.1 beta-glucosides PTS, EIIA [Lactiplantibacillus paraplantarum DSM 10667]GEO60747.1 PTS lactose transporter subunit IIA [Lactiplantibacillus paraplantarum]